MNCGEEIKINQMESVVQHGGKRQGAGRKAEAISHYRERFFRSRGVGPLMAKEILASIEDERKVWKRLLNSQDDRVVLQAMLNLMWMRDGKPAQQINVTSANINLNAADIAQARAIVAEIRGELVPALASGGQVVETKALVAPKDGPGLQPSIMLAGDEGDEKGGGRDGKG